MFSLPRMVVCLVLTLVLMALSLFLQQVIPGSLLAVTLYKAHLMALGGWGGYWLDRATFPYARPESILMTGSATDRTARIYCIAMLRRAIIVAACLICVGLGA